MSVFPTSDTRLNTTNFLIREVATVSMFGGNQQIVKTNPSNETRQNKFTGVKDTLNSFNRELTPIIRVLQGSGIIPITKTPRGITSLSQAVSNNIAFRRIRISEWPDGAAPWHQCGISCSALQVGKVADLKNGFIWDVTPCGSCKN
jgi:hypothetical protein